MSINIINKNQLNMNFLDYYSYLHGTNEKSVQERGAVFTRHEVVDFILDLSSYTTDLPLHKYCLLEPSFGEGDFLIPAVRRLITAYKRNTPSQLNIVNDLSGAIRAVEINKTSIKNAWTKLFDLLLDNGISISDANQLLEQWLIEGDFLLIDINNRFSHVVGNPPYVRQEMISDALMIEYRLRYSTIYDRADIYVPFIERSLDVLLPNGVLGFICADRWMKNKYGALLREKIAINFHLSDYVDMVDTPAFHSNVMAYPAITIIKNEMSGPTRIARQPKIDSKYLSKLALSMKSETIQRKSNITEIFNIVNKREPWIFDSIGKLSLVRRLENDFPCLEDTGCKVGIGVATGSDKAYIDDFNNLDVEPDRKLPLIKTKDVKTGEIIWQGLGVINPFNNDGQLVELSKYPRLAKYFENRQDLILKRNCAKKNPKNWYRTIDKIKPDLTYTKKLLIPDIKGNASIIYEDGKYYPHHNLYFIISDEWDLQTLQCILQSGIADLFVSLYSTKMRGGFFRFQAQYLRRIRIPKWIDVSENIRTMFHESIISGDIELCKTATSKLYGLNGKERDTLFENNSGEGL